MMDRNYPTSSFADPLASPAQTVASWAYDRSSAALKPSSSYGAGHLDTELLQRQSYTSTHLPSYSTSQLSAAGTLDTSGNSTESIMSFLSAMESRTLQAGPASASLLPPFRPTSWPAGTNSSSTELYLTGALPSTATFPSPAALSSYQHTAAYSSNPTLLQDPTFSTSANGLFTHDPLLHVKSSQTVLPTALAFNHLSGPPLGSALPVQSSTYRSAQESAPHLLQPQFSLLPTALPVTHSGTHPYGSTVFSGSVERSLQRECSVIKHHQRPSSSHVASEQLSSSEHSLQGYFGSGTDEDVSYQRVSSSETSVSLSPPADSASTAHGPQSKTDSSTLAYSSTSVLKTTDCSSKLSSHSVDGGDDLCHAQNHSAEPSDRYSSTVHKQSSVIAHQQSMQMSTLMSSGLSQPYVASQSSHANSDKLPTLYKPSFSSSSDSVTSASQSLAYSSRSGLSPEQVVQYQIPGLCPASFSESFTSSQVQGVPSVTYTSYSQSHVSASQGQTCTTAQSVNPSYQPATLLTSNTAQDFSIMQTAVEAKSHDSLSQHGVQAKHIYGTTLATFSSENSSRSSQQDVGPSYDKQKVGELAVQDLQALQTSSTDGTINSQNTVSKSEDKMQGVIIRGNLPSEDKFTGHTSTTQNSRVGSLVDGPDNTNSKVSNSSVASSHVLLNSEPLQLKTPDPSLQSLNQPQAPATHSHFISAQGSQVLLEPNQMILLQQPLVHQGPAPLKTVQGEDIGPAQYLQMAREILGINTQSQRSTLASGSNSECTDSTKHIFSQNTNHHSHDSKNQFVLNSICFPDSMLLADERHILSNVDDILAATVAACGVAPQDFAKSVSSSEANMAAMASPANDKGFFPPVQTVDLRHLSPSFSSASPAVLTNSHVIALNGVQMTPDSTNGNGKNPENHVGQVIEGHQNKPVKGNGKCATEDCLMECLDVDGFPKKKVPPKTKPGSEEDGDPTKPAKRSSQPKRQNSKGADASSPAPPQTPHDGCPQQERIRQKIREVEEKQPEVKTGFMGSFLDFIKSGPKQQFSPNPSRTINRTKKTVSSAKPPQCTFYPHPPNLRSPPAPLAAQDSRGAVTQQKRLDEDLQKNLETLPSFSSDEEENTGRNLALRNSICSALSALDETTDRKVKTDTQISIMMIKPESAPHAIPEGRLRVAPVQAMTITVPAGPVFLSKEDAKESPIKGELAAELKSVAIEGLTDEELSDSGGEGMYRERDEFVVRNEDIESLKATMTTGSEPPAIWKVQKALLQKFVPELRDGKRVFSATNSYLGYFGDAKTMYQRIYVKFLDTVNKREYVRVCSRKPRCKPITSLRGLHVRTMLSLTAPPSTFSQSQKPRPKQVKTKAEPPPKKRKKWKEEFSPAASGSSAEDPGESGPSASHILIAQATKETFRSFVELLISVALDEDVVSALEKSNDELLLPHMRSVDGVIADHKKHLLQKLHVGQVLKTALDNFPEISVVTELKKDGETPAYKVRLSGRAYNKKTMKTYRMPNKVPQEYTVDQQRTQLLSLYHSVQHFKYHTYLMCKDKIASLQVQAGDLGQERTVQECLKNHAWVEGLFDRFEELVNQVQQACR
ncbi:glutamine and serine-rich protein 1 [Neosynchiropus ocellatus]